LVTVIAAGFAIWNLRGERLADEMQNTKNLAVVLAEQTTRSFQAVDLVLQEMQAMVLAAAIEKPDQFKLRMGTEEVHDFLAGRVKSLPQANAVALFDAAGRLANFSRPWPIPVMDVSDREYFQFLRDHPAPVPFIGPPVRSKVSGAWTITIARRLSGPNGEFFGIAAGYVEARYFEDFYKAISREAGESVSLFHRDGTLLARHPHIEEMTGEKLSTASPWYAQVANGGGTYHTPGYIGGVPRIISVQPAREYPLAVTVGVSEYEALAPWRRQSLLIMIGAVGALIGFAILVRALAVQFRRLEQRSAVSRLRADLVGLVLGDRREPSFHSSVGWNRSVCRRPRRLYRPQSHRICRGCRERYGQMGRASRDAEPPRTLPRVQLPKKGR
jgi:hypothetical protein